MNGDDRTQGISGLGDILYVLGKWRRFIVTNVLVVTVVVAVISLLLPRWYRSTATILPPKNQDLLGMLGSAASSLTRSIDPLKVLGGGRSSDDFYRYLAIIKSRTLLERVVTKFDLTTVYGIPREESYKAIDELESNINTKVNEEGTLSIEVSDRDSVRAAGIAQYVVQTLDEINQQLGAREARSNREFLEQRVAQTEKDMHASEEALKDFQQKHGFIVPNDKTTEGISAVAELYAKKTLKELEVGLLKRTVGDHDPRLTIAELELSELDNKLKDVPELGVTYLRLYRDFTIQQRIYQTIVPILEQAKIEEQRDTPTLLVLDYPTVPKLAYSPKKKVIVIVFFFITLLISTGVALLMENLQRMKQQRPEEYERLLRGWQELTRWAKVRRTPDQSA